MFQYFVALYMNIVIYYIKRKGWLKGEMYMKAEIIAVGTELLLGDILNTNARFIARQLAELGITLQYQTVVGDNEQRLSEALDIAFNRADIIITSGGLGPTDDDITKETAAKYFNKEMVLDERSRDRLLTYFKGRNMSPTNMKQVYMPKGAIVLDNDNGTAPGCIITDKGKTIAVLPGPPSELVPMFENGVRSYLEKQQEFTLVSKVLHLSGIGESAAAEQIRELMQKSSNPTIAPYAKTNEMVFRITARGKDKEECQALIKPVADEIYSRLGQFIYGEDDETLVSAVMKRLIEKGLTVASAESCTGGMVASRLIDYPGASAVFMTGFVTYTNESKAKFLGVSEDTLEKYGAVSPQTAEEMCIGAAERSGADIGISTTGIAGPGGGTAEKPVGLVYIGVSVKGKAVTKKLQLSGSRNKIRNAAAAAAIELLRQQIIQEDKNGKSKN